MTDRHLEKTMTIGQFGRLCQLSRKALRLYEQRGVLLPAHVDPDSGYRYYTRSQIEVAQRIRLLRLMELPLDGVAAVLAAWDRDEATVQRLNQRARGANGKAAGGCSAGCAAAA